MSAIQLQWLGAGGAENLKEWLSFSNTFSKLLDLETHRDNFTRKKIEEDSFKLRFVCLLDCCLIF